MYFYLEKNIITYSSDKRSPMKINNDTAYNDVVNKYVDAHIKTDNKFTLHVS